ncbi:C-type lectin-like isoform X2 [Daphnia pulicaria]|uniref:C-type lectin-like isoform X2 n=1 Tax=Daphnia pulicaria TaxID=35523 RepID=UPI001EEC2370|nr:C-type lectin-like isoform X2 [Daphnia pulicaria]
MQAFSFPGIFVCIVGVLLFKGQVSEQFAVIQQESESDMIPADQTTLIEDKTEAACQGSIGTNKCIKTNGVCYCFVPQQLPWLKAYEFCNSYRKNLISIQSTKDQQVVTQFLMPLILNDPVAKNIGVWTSGASVPGLKTYFWVSKLSLFFYSNWFYGEPRPTSLSECVRIAPVPEGPWASTPCEQWLPFVCQD